MHTPEPSADGLLTLLAVARTGRYTAAADLLGINHTTASRRVAALERALGGPLLARSAAGWELTELGRSGVAAAERIEAVLHGLDADTDHDLHGKVRIAATDGFSARVVAPAIATLGRAHPRLSVDLLTVTRRAPSTRSGVDMEVVVGRPATYRVEPVLLAPYRLGLYGSRDYLAAEGTPQRPRQLAGRPLVYFIDSMLTVDDLDLARVLVPGMADRLSSTNVLVHVEATCAGAGLGLLPCFLADDRPELVRVLPDEVSVQLEYWMVVRPEAAQRREVAAVVTALRAQVRSMRAALLGEG
ncbi:LysR family transcriptional regulator [Tsukamurella spumae]|uniref:LysR family transcriptional regulator n=1 Tax=Tsukamurella spumae TaxID=44753 RepID=A0A846X935_9ACTN|nr:LysR family transcriptional regulator [Tsukamurella spumae]NKY20779.1 LysR family transcriptional regulator [Tsukamurella spumae]